MDQVFDLWSPLIGRLAWGVRRGHGSFVTMEFGLPHLVVREPMESRSRFSKVQRLLKRRAVYVEGDWHFSIVYGDWKLTTVNGVLSSEDGPNSALDEVLHDLDGQRLISLERGDRPASYVWKFDLGGILEISPSVDIPDDLWTLHRFNKDIIACGPDGWLTSELITEPVDARP